MPSLLNHVKSLANVQLPTSGSVFAPAGERLTPLLCKDQTIGFLSDDLLDAFKTSAFIVEPGGVRLREDQDFTAAFREIGAGRTELRGEDSLLYVDGQILARVDRNLKRLLNMHTLATNLVGSTVVNGETKLWVGKRAANKAWCPSMYDNIAGGGLRPISPAENMVEEAHEEASIDREWARANIEAVGYISAVNVYRNEFCIDIDHCFEADLPASMKPAPLDGEVERFSLMSIDEVKDSIVNGLWMPDAALVTIDWLHRHGYLRDDPDEQRIASLLRHPLYRIP